MELGKIKVKVEVDTSELDEALEKIKEYRKLLESKQNYKDKYLHTTKALLAEAEADKMKLINFLEENIKKTHTELGRMGFEKTLRFIEDNL